MIQTIFGRTHLTYILFSFLVKIEPDTSIIEPETSIIEIDSIEPQTQEIDESSSLFHTYSAATKLIFDESDNSREMNRAAKKLEMKKLPPPILPQPHLCEICNNLFLNDFCLKEHLEEVHKIYKCDNCDKKFNSASDLKRHIKAYPPGECNNPR